MAKNGLAAAEVIPAAAKVGPGVGGLTELDHGASQMTVLKMSHNGPKSSIPEILL